MTERWLVKAPFFQGQIIVTDEVIQKRFTCDAFKKFHGKPIEVAEDYAAKNGWELENTGEYD